MFLFQWGFLYGQSDYLGTYDPSTLHCCYGLAAVVSAHRAVQSTVPNYADPIPELDRPSWLLDWSTDVSEKAENARMHGAISSRQVYLIAGCKRKAGLSVWLHTYHNYR